MQNLVPYSIRVLLFVVGWFVVAGVAQAQGNPDVEAKFIAMLKNATTRNRGVAAISGWMFVRGRPLLALRVSVHHTSLTGLYQS